MKQRVKTTKNIEHNMKYNMPSTQTKQAKHDVRKNARILCNPTIYNPYHNIMNVAKDSSSPVALNKMGHPCITNI